MSHQGRVVADGFVILVRHVVGFEESLKIHQAFIAWLHLIT